MTIKINSELSCKICGSNRLERLRSKSIFFPLIRKTVSYQTTKITFVIIAGSFLCCLNLISLC